MSYSHSEEWDPVTYRRTQKVSTSGVYCQFLLWKNMYLLEDLWHIVPAQCKHLRYFWIWQLALDAPELRLRFWLIIMGALISMYRNTDLGILELILILRIWNPPQYSVSSPASSLEWERFQLHAICICIQTIPRDSGRQHWDSSAILDTSNGIKHQYMGNWIEPF